MNVFALAMTNNEGMNVYKSKEGPFGFNERGAQQILQRHPGRRIDCAIFTKWR